MNPPTRNRVTDSGVRPAMAATTGMPCAAISSHAGSSSARKAVTTRCVTALGTTLRYIDAVLGGEVEQPQDAGPRVAADVGCRRGERDGERGRDRVVAVAEVLVEDLSADTGAGDDVADGDLVDRALRARARTPRRASRVRTRSARGSALWVRAAMTSSVGHFVDN